MLNKTQFHAQFLDHFGFQPTDSQGIAIEQLSDFIYGKGDNCLFLLQGYAGTGKTSLVSALVKTLEEVKVRTVLLAPTGRAAKVFAQFADRKAFTIHKWIYRVSSRNGQHFFARKENKYSHTLFIVDEASMISTETSSGEMLNVGNLLDDLMDYVYSGEHNRMLFIGDDAQLPPVHASESPALNAEYLQSAYHLLLSKCRLINVVRQTLQSGILHNATLLRHKINLNDFTFPLFTDTVFEDFTRLNGGALEELLNTLYQKFDADEIVTITRSNKRANLFNNEIRNRILFRENTIATGDYIMAVKNNYFWVEENSEVGFIANGDIMEIIAIHKRQEIYGFNFADVTVRLCDYPNYPNIDIKIILQSLSCDSASLGYEDTNKLYLSVAEDYMNITNKRTRYLHIKNDPYLNAVQVKFAYSLTCHKTQGGQWKNVLIDQGYLPDDALDKEYMRWLYTAITRGTQNVYLINFKNEMFGEITTALQ